MVLIDTSIWIDHIRTSDEVLTELLDGARLSMHPFIMGELAIGHLPDRQRIMRDLHRLPQMAVATPHEVLHLVERHRLFGLGIGYVDANLLASTKLTPGASLWTRDKRLRAAAQALSLDAKTTH